MNVVVLSSLSTSSASKWANTLANAIQSACRCSPVSTPLCLDGSRPLVASTEHTHWHARQVPLPHRPDRRPASGAGQGVWVRPRGFNDALAERRRAYQAGEWISDTEVQRRVITQAKRTPERAWLTEVASVALVQACQDARRAYRNWFDSLKGKRKVAGSGTQGFGPSTAASRSGSPVTASRSTGVGRLHRDRRRAARAVGGPRGRRGLGKRDRRLHPPGRRRRQPAAQLDPVRDRHPRRPRDR